MPDITMIALHRIDEPELAQRSEMDEGNLAELADDIKRNGLIHPVSVYRVGDRYRIAAGHRRYLACRMANHDPIEARDYTDSGIAPEAIMFAENGYREQVSDCDMAVWLFQIQEKYHLHIDKLMQITGKSENWINTRLSLFNGDERVFTALQSGQINLGHAVELNKFADELRLTYLETVIRSTPPVVVLRQWRKDIKAQNVQPSTITESEQQPAVPMPLPGVVVDACWWCESNVMPWSMRHVKVHDHCLDALKKAQQQQ